MALQDIFKKMGFFLLIGFGIALCLIGGSNVLWHHAYRIGIIYFSIGALLTFIFYRKRIIILAFCILAFAFVNVGLTTIFHPSLAGYVVTLGSMAGLVILVRWQARKHPELQGKDWRKIWF